MTTIKERPILFSAPMVKAILAGRKTQTRRIMKPQPTAFWNDGRQPVNLPYDREKDKIIRCPYGGTGDRLWVRETWAVVPQVTDNGPKHKAKGDGTGATWRADWNGNPSGFKWKPSILMPRWASRINLEITGIRVERLHDITEDDAQAEGVQLKGESAETSQTYRQSFAWLWHKINGMDSWSANPFVWVVEFKRIQP